MHWPVAKYLQKTHTVSTNVMIDYYFDHYFTECKVYRLQPSHLIKVLFFSFERNNPYYFFPANQQKASTKIYSLTQCSLSVNECDWHIWRAMARELMHIVWLERKNLAWFYWIFKKHTKRSYLSLRIQLGALKCTRVTGATEVPNFEFRKQLNSSLKGTSLSTYSLCVH